MTRMNPQHGQDAMPMHPRDPRVGDDDPLRFQPMFIPPREDPEPVEIIDLDSNRLAVKDHTWGGPRRLPRFLAGRMKRDVV